MTDFIDFEAVQDNQNDVIMVSDDENKENEVCDDFINDFSALDEVDASFYRAADIQ